MKISHSIFTMVALALVVAIMPEMALAGGLDEIVGGGLCDVVADMTGGVAQAVATLGVLILGIGAFFGKVNWGLAVLFAVGIAAMFGAATIVGTIGGTEACVDGGTGG